MLVIDYSKLEKIKRQNDKIICACPACRLEGRDSTGNHMVVYSNGAFGCCANPDKTHYKQILDLVGINEENLTPESKSFVEHQDITMPKKFDKSILDSLNPDHSYWKSRGINTEIFNKFNITAGILNEEKLKNRHTTVFFNDKKQIIGFAGRSLLKNHPIKWKNLGDKKEFLLLDGLNIDLIKETKTVNLVESLGDFYSCLSSGIYNVIPIFGTNISTKVFKILISLNPETINIITNNDPVNEFGKQPGQDGAKKIKKILKTFFDSVNIIIPPENDLNLMLIKHGPQSLVDLIR